MEAMAARKILLCRYDNTLVNVISEGQTGFFFNNEMDFGDKLEEVLNLSEDKKEKIRNNALKIIDKYSMEKFYENAYEVYQRAVRQMW